MPTPSDSSSPLVPYATKVETPNGVAIFFRVQPTLLQKQCARDLLALGVQLNKGLEELSSSLPEGYSIEFRGNWDCLVIKDS